MDQVDSVNELFKQYIDLSKQINDLKEQQKTIKKEVEKIEKSIKEYMKNNDMDSISLKDAEIVLYDKKISQTFKKETITEKLTEELADPNKAEELAKSIVQNKKFIVENKIKVVIKKKN
jgi:uncharacterized protein involved in exopolysaccharide biosynthesis